MQILRRGEGGLLKKDNKTINIGDRFVKADEPTKVWVVTELGAPISSIPHYQVM